MSERNRPRSVRAFPVCVRVCRDCPAREEELALSSFFFTPQKTDSLGVPAHTPFPAISLSSSSAVPSSAAPTPQKLWLCTVQPPPPNSTELSGPFGPPLTLLSLSKLL